MIIPVINPEIKIIGVLDNTKQMIIPRKELIRRCINVGIYVNEELEGTAVLKWVDLLDSLDGYDIDDSSPTRAWALMTVGDTPDELWSMRGFNRVKGVTIEV